MRCPVCGTENTPDSRFCGGCGAKQSPSAARVAPTAKIPDDAQFPQSIPPGAYSAPQPIQRHPSMPPAASMPPPASVSRRAQSALPVAMATPRPQSVPPVVGSIPPRAQSAPPGRVASPSVSMPAAPRRRGGLIAVVVVIDLALAAAGALLLAQGLGRPSADPATAPVIPPPAPSTLAPGDAATSGSSASAAPPPAPEPAARAAAASRPAAQRPAAPPVKLAAAPPAPTSPEAAAVATQVSVSSVPAALPVVPYGTDLQDEVDRKAASDQAALNECKRAGVRGTVEVAFQVLPGGGVAHAAAVSNTTGSIDVATCLAHAIGGWTFTSRPREAAGFVRRFAYP